MDLGWMDVCIRVTDIAVSRQFYEALGFHKVEGEDSEGWAVMVNGEARIGPFESQFMSVPFSFNFRGGDIAEICKSAESNGIELVRPMKVGKNGSSAEIRDPNGIMIVFETATNETKQL